MQAGDTTERINELQQTTLRDLLKKAGRTEEQFIAYAALDKLGDLAADVGLAPVFNTRPSQKGADWITITCDLVHESGYSKEFSRRKFTNSFSQKSRAP